MSNEAKKDSFAGALMRVFKGMIVGTGAILPGVSGGAMCAAFGIYRPLMDFLAHPRRDLKKNAAFFLPFVIGCALGFILLADIVARLLSINAGPVIVFFIGCVIATLPSLYREADGRNWNLVHWLILTASTGLSAWGLHAMTLIDANLVPVHGTLTAYITWILSGIVFSLGTIVPGMSPSSILLYVDLYEPMCEGLGRLDMSIVLPFLFGIVLCIALFSKLVSWLFEKANKTMFAVVIGIVIASTLMLIPKESTLDDGTTSRFVIDAVTQQPLLTAVCFIGGLALVLALGKLDKFKENENTK